MLTTRTVSTTLAIFPSNGVFLSRARLHLGPGSMKSILKKRAISYLSSKSTSHPTKTYAISPTASISIGRTPTFRSQTTISSIGSNADQQQRPEDTCHETDSSLDIVLYQYRICPFCHKAKSLLAYASQPYESIEVNPLTKAELKPWSGDYKKVPIAVINGEQVNGSDEIVSTLLSNPTVSKNLTAKLLLQDKNGMSLSEFQNSESAKKWMQFANDDLAALVYPNICRTLRDSYRAFGYVDDVPKFSTWEKMGIRGVGSLAMYFAASRIKSKRGIKDERQALNDALQKWQEEGLEHGTNKFASKQSAPDMGDVAVFSTLRSIEGLDVHNEIMQANVVLEEWYNHMRKELYGEV